MPMAAPGDACVSDEDLVALLEGRLDAGARDALERHADGCEPCLGLLQETVGSYYAERRASRAVADTAPARPAEAAPERLDEFLILRPLGRGAMGQVYLA